MTREFIDFVNAHLEEDTARLLLSAGRYPGVDVAAAVEQIEGRRTAREKWPGLLGCAEFLFPPRLNREQASSEATARYKASIAGLPTATDGLRVADLTGGMGVDTIAFAMERRQGGGIPHPVDYVERDPRLCELMEHNCRALGLDNVTVHCGDSMAWLAQTSGRYDLFFIDPARRDGQGRKVAAFEDCTPDLLQHLDLLMSRCRRLMVKASPMIDIDLAVRQLGAVEAVHVVAARGECKEVLFVCGEPQGEPQMVCCHLGVSTLAFRRGEEARAEARYCAAVGHYLYAPDAAVMKGGPYRLLCQRYGVDKLGSNTHLYTSDRLVRDFPGRRFEVLQEMKASRREAQALIPGGKAHVMVRNYPTEAAALQRQLGLREGGERFVVATTVGRDRKAFLCRQEA